MSIKKTAFVFPGQGSQSVGLLASFVDHLPFIEAVFSKASASLGYDVWALAQQGPREQLSQTCYTQPVLLTASMALWQLWQCRGGALPDFLAGHSLGEYTAYTCAESFQLEEVVQLVAQRGAHMQTAMLNIEGAMAVIIGLTLQQVTAICEQVKESDIVAVSSDNAYDQIVISGHLTAVDRAMRLAMYKGARFTKQLQISVPAHCDLMRPVTQYLADTLDSISCQPPRITVVSSASSTVLSDTDAIKNSLVAQLYQPVYWVDTIRYLLKQGVNCFIECGPGRVLTGLIQRIAPQVSVISIGDVKGFQKALSGWSYDRR